MNKILGIVLRSGVVLSGVIIATGTGLFIANHSLDDTTSYLAYNPSVVPHGNFPASLASIAPGLASLNPSSTVGRDCACLAFRLGTCARNISVEGFHIGSRKIDNRDYGCRKLDPISRDQSRADSERGSVQEN